MYETKLVRFQLEFVNSSSFLLCVAKIFNVTTLVNHIKAAVVSILAKYTGLSFTGTGFSRTPVSLKLDRHNFQIDPPKFIHMANIHGKFRQYSRQVIFKATLQQTYSEHCESRLNLLLNP